MKNGKRKAVVVFGGVVVMSALFAPVVSAAVPPSRVPLAVVSVTGACEIESVTHPSPTSQFTVKYRSNRARAGGDAAPDEARTKCQVVLRSDGPEGFTYGISSIGFRGTADLAAGARGTLKAAHYFEGGLPNTYTHTIPGPYSRFWLTEHKIDIGQMVFKPCGVERPLYLDTELRADVGSADPSKTNVISMDTADEPTISTNISLTWKKCG